MAGSARALLARDVVCALLGALALVLKDACGGPPATAVHDYAGNASVSFALYFALLAATRERPHGRVLAAAAAFAAVTAFELTDGFGVMVNVYDPVDLLANAAGVGAAVVVDLVSTAVITGLMSGTAPRPR